MMKRTLGRVSLMHALLLLLSFHGGNCFCVTVDSDHHHDGGINKAPRSCDDVMPERPNSGNGYLMKRWLLISNWRQRRWQQQRPRGSFLTVQTPTPERLALWFGTRTSERNRSCDDWSLVFNHPHAGLTNPDNVPVPPTTIERNDNDNNNDWWPACRENTSLSSSTVKRKWRVLRFRRCHVGQGLAFYQRVRNAALAWEFASDTKGILQIPESTTCCSNNNSSTSSCSSKQGLQRRDENGLQSSLGRVVFDDENHTQTVATPILSLDLNKNDWPKPKRRLATYTSIRLVPKWLSRIAGDRKLYCLNPVHVVYDWIDQRDGRGYDSSHSSTLYTSTAYATGKGHWLRGEERVTIAMRENGRVDIELLSFSRPAKSFIGWLVWPIIGKMQTTFFLQELDALERVARA